MIKTFWTLLDETKLTGLSITGHLSAFNLSMGIVNPQEKGCGTQHFPNLSDHKISFLRIPQYNIRKADLTLSENNQQKERR